MRIVGYLRDTDAQAALAGAAARMNAELTLVHAGGDGNGEPDQLAAALRTHPDVILAQPRADRLAALRADTRARGICLVVVCESDADVQRAVEAGSDDWLLLPTDEAEIAARVRTVGLRVQLVGPPRATATAAEHLKYEELLYDRHTGFPTLPVMLEQARELLERRGRLTVLYIQFVRYSKLEEIYGWEKLDEVLQSTANAVREFYDRHQGTEENLLMVSHTGDDDFIFFTDLPEPMSLAEKHINDLVRGLERHVRERLEAAHGEDVAGLFEIYIGSSTIFRNPKMRTERMIYRGIREAAAAARGVEGRERSRKVEDLKTLIREEGIYIVYHPIVVTATREVFGYEALARGATRSLRSPEVLFGVAEEANLIWELSRLCRKRAIEGIDEHLKPEHLLFINIDPHDFRDPSFRYLDLSDLGVKQPERIVLEITERTAITDYPKFQGYLKEFRSQGFRFAVDDAGSGYAGLGSIANLEPDFIKLDISLISGIDANFMKQNLVETMVSFANDHNIQVIAEGVEREEEYEAVKRLGVHLTQGFLFHDASKEAEAEAHHVG